MAKHSVSEIAAGQLSAAKGDPEGRSSELLVGDDDSSLQQTVVAMVEGNSMELSEGADDATLLVLSGSLRVRTADGPEDAVKGDLVEVPKEPHTITARRDSTALLTVSSDES